MSAKGLTVFVLRLTVLILQRSETGPSAGWVG